MSPSLTVVLLALIPAGANFLGGLLAEVREVSPAVLSAALHVAVGIVVAVVGLEVMPRALEVSPPWVPMLAFVAGAGLFLGIDAATERLQQRGGGEGRAWAVYGGVGLDLFSDGVLIGTGTVVNPALGVLLALGQAPADFPEGFAASATLRRAGLGRARRILAAASFAVPILIGAALGYFALRDAPDLVTFSVLAFTGGALLSVALEEMLPQAHDEASGRRDAFYIVAGFALFAAVSTYLSQA
ncbi:MAG: ZIP family metal transporter [Pseudonocardia sp.]|nr:ZIP family metal transporter [Pseudonocardia sp.]